MSFDDHLIHTCTIENPATGSIGPYNNASKAYGTPVTGVRCRLVEARERIWNDELQESVIESVYQLFVKADVTISERAKISLVTMEDATTISDTFEVKELLVRRGRSAHHKMAVLERIS